MKNDFCAAWPVTTKRIGFIFRTSLIKTSWTDYIRGRPPCGEPLTETPRHGEKFLLGTPTSSSASSLRSGFSFASFAPAHVASGCLRQATQPAPAGMCSCMPDSIASLPIRIPARISRSLGSLRWGCSMQGSDLRGHLKNQFLTSNTAAENMSICGTAPFPLNPIRNQLAINWF